MDMTHRGCARVYYTYTRQRERLTQSQFAFSEAVLPIARSGEISIILFEKKFPRSNSHGVLLPVVINDYLVRLKNELGYIDVVSLISLSDNKMGVIPTCTLSVTF